jgi:hypothetical protein
LLARLRAKHASNCCAPEPTCCEPAPCCDAPAPCCDAPAPCCGAPAPCGGCGDCGGVVVAAPCADCAPIEVMPAEAGELAAPASSSDDAVTEAPPAPTPDANSDK